MENKLENGLISQVDILSIVKDVVRQWWVILLLALSASMLTNVWVDYTYKPEYTVTSTFVVTAKGMNSNIYQNLSSTKELAERFSQVLNSSILKKKVAEELGLKEFDAKTSAEVLPETNLMELEVKAGTAMEAYHVIKSIMENYSTVSDYVVENVVLEVIQPPLIPSGPSNRPDMNGVMKNTFMISTVILILCFAAFSHIKDTVKNEKEVSEKVDAKLLGTIYHERKVKSLSGVKKAKSLSMLIDNPMLSFRFVESNKMTATKVRSYMERKGIQTLLLTSVMENEGKSTVAANLALSLAHENKKVLLIDCDFRKPAQYKIFDMPAEEASNLPDMLRNNQKEIQSLIKKRKESGLYTVFNSASASSMEELMEKGVLKKMLEFFKDRMEYIIIDSSPLALVADTEELAQMVDASVLVIKQDTVLTKDINDAVDVLNNTRGKVLGCIFNDVMTGVSGSTGHYGYGGHYGKRTE